MHEIDTFTYSNLVISVATEPGHQKQHNTDEYMTFAVRTTTPDGAAEEMVPVAVLAGGVGAHHQRASQLAVEAIYGIMRSHMQWPIPQRLVEAFRHANRVIYQQATANPQVAGMGATAIAAAVLSDTLYLAYVGDCRAYLLRQDLPYLLTIALPPSPVTALATAVTPRSPLPPPSQVHVAGAGHLLGRTQGVEVATAIILPEHRLSQSPMRLTSQLPLTATDTLLLCTPGLPHGVARPEMAHTLAHAPVQEAARQLVMDASQVGPTDDGYTALLIRQIHRRTHMSPMGKRLTLRAGLLAAICLLLVLVAFSSLAEPSSRLAGWPHCHSNSVRYPSAQETTFPSHELVGEQNVAALPATLALTPIATAPDASTTPPAHAFAATASSAPRQRLSYQLIGGWWRLQLVRLVLAWH
ncbi:MAG: hypothetical protein R3E79_54365 [Caldilineaceae bacterium]